jgi:hypothetical protein
MDYNGMVEKISRWIPSKSDLKGVDDFLSGLYNFIDNANITPVFDTFNKKINKINYDFVPGSKESGAICFFGSVIMSLLQVGHIRNMESLFTFASCYILIDHYIDNDEISMIDKLQTIQQIQTFITDNKNDTGIGDNEILNVISSKYIDMVNNVPNASPYLVRLFNIEITTMLLQKRSDLSWEKYIEISESKGGLTTQAIQALLDLPVTNSEYILGSGIQCSDDLMDITDDIGEKINTFVTHDYTVNGNIDSSVLHTINTIDKIDNKYSIFKILLMLEVTLAVTIHKDKISEKLWDVMKDYIYFNPNVSKDKIMKWLHNKIIL